MPAIHRAARHMAMLLFGLGLCALPVYLGGIDELSRFDGLGTLGLLGALGATFGITGTIALRWGVITRALHPGARVSWQEFYHYFITSRIFGYFIPKDLADLGGRAAWLNRKHGIPVTAAGTSVVLDRAADLGNAILMAVAVVPFWLGWVDGVEFVVLLAGVSSLGLLALSLGGDRLFVALDRLLQYLSRVGRRLPWLGRRLGTVPRLTHLGRGQTVRVYLLSQAKFVFTVTRYAMFAYALGLDLSPGLILAGTPLVQLSYAVAVTPGGLGFLELSWYGALTWGGAAADDAALFVLGQRLLTMVLVSCLAAVSQTLHTLQLRLPRLDDDAGKCRA